MHWQWKINEASRKRALAADLCVVPSFGIEATEHLRGGGGVVVCCRGVCVDTTSVRARQSLTLRLENESSDRGHGMRVRVRVREKIVLNSPFSSRLSK